MVSKAADQGIATAQFNLGVVYANGRGVPTGRHAAVAWYRQAADQGHADAQYNLGSMYYKGAGLPQDFTQAVAWYRKAADQGNATAQYNLGVVYANGRGVPQDRHASGGVVSPSSGPGVRARTDQPRPHVRHRAGRGAGLCGGAQVAQLAASRVTGDDQSDMQRHGTRPRKMTPAQLAEAQRLAREWQAAFEKRQAE